MQKTLTPESLLLFVYDEISDPAQRDEMAKAIRLDNEAYEEYNLLGELREMIDDSLHQPSQQAINNILNYSKALSVVHMSDHRTLGLVLN